MICYLLSQGTNSSEYGFILKNDSIIKPNDSLREEIIGNIESIDRKGKTISKENSSLKLKKFRNNYLIEVMTTNTDRLGRKVPVELLIVNYLKNNNLNEKLSSINSLLKEHNIVLDDNEWNNISLELELFLKRDNKRKIRKFLIGVAVALISIVIIIILTYKQQENEKHLEQENNGFSNRSSIGWIDPYR